MISCFYFGCATSFNPFSLPPDPWTACLSPAILRFPRTPDGNPWRFSLRQSRERFPFQVHKPHAHRRTRAHTHPLPPPPGSRTSPSAAALPAPLLPSASSARRPSDQHGGAGERGAERPAVGPQAERAVRARGNRGSPVPHGEDSAGRGRGALQGEVWSSEERPRTGTREGSIWEEAGMPGVKKSRERCGFLSEQIDAGSWPF